MDKPIAHSNNFPPWYIRQILTCRFGHIPCGFTDDLYILDECKLQLAFYVKVVARFPRAIVKASRATYSLCFRRIMSFFGILDFRSVEDFLAEIPA